MAAPQSNPYPPAPGENDFGEDFDTLGRAFAAALEPRRLELQAQVDFVNDAVENIDMTVNDAVAGVTTTATNARDTSVSSANTAVVAASDAEQFRDQSEDAKAAALALVNFAGKWEDLVGSLNTPATVFHNGSYWYLLTDLADVTASEPANGNAAWLFVYTNAELRRKLLDEASLYADFENGDYRLYEGVGAGIVRNKTFAQLFPDFSRGSSADGFGASALETVSSDIARFVYSPELKKRLGLLIERDTTNLVLFSSDLGNTDEWDEILGGSAVSNSATGIDGNQSAATVSGTEINSRVRQNIAITPGVQYVASCYAEKNQSTQMEFRLRDGFETDGIVQLNTFTGEIVLGAGDTVGVIDEGDFWRVYASSLSNGTNAQIRVFPDRTENRTSQVIDVVQLEPGSYPSAPVRTEATTVSRDADFPSRDFGPEFNPKRGTIIIECPDVSQGSYLLKTKTNNWGIRRAAGSSFAIYNRLGGGNNDVSAPGPARPKRNIVAVAYDEASSTNKVCANGGSVASGQFDGLIGETGFNLGAFSSASAQRIDGVLFKMVYVARVYTDAQLQAITQPEAQ